MFLVLFVQMGTPPILDWDCEIGLKKQVLFWSTGSRPLKKNKKKLDLY
jgi:hypothetical protein